MKEKQINEKTCTNCRYYSQHFSKQGTRYNKIHCGHCLHKNIKKYKRCPLELCEDWEDIAIQKDERKKSIKETLEFISERLNDIVMILKEDIE